MSAVATPPAMFAPARLCTSRAPVRSRMPATIAAVVVLPLVAEITALPRCRRAPRRAMAWGSRRIRSLPGSEVPPRPVRRESAPAARAAATLTSRAVMRAAGPAARAGQGAEGHRQLADRVAVGVDDERPVGADVHLGAAQHVHARLVDVLALEHLGQHAAQEARLARALEPDDVQGPVVELGIGRDEHPAPVGLGVRHRDAPPGEGDPLAIDLERELGRLPGDQRPQRAVDVDQRAEARRRLVGDPVGIGVEAQRRDPDEGRLAGLAEVDGARLAVGDDVARRLRVQRDAGHAREVVAAPAGQHAQHARPGPRAARRRPCRASRRR